MSSHCTYQKPRSPGALQSREVQHLSTAHFRSLTTNHFEVAMGSQVSPLWVMQYEHSCWRSLRFLGSLSFVYFSCSMFPFCPLGYSARSFPVSHLSETWAVTSVGWEEKMPHWCKLGRWLPTPSALSQVRSAWHVPPRTYILEEHTLVPFTSENPDPSRAGGVHLLQTDSVCGTGTMIVLLLLTNAHSGFSPFYWHTPCTASNM